MQPDWEAKTAVTQTSETPPQTDEVPASGERTPAAAPCGTKPHPRVLGPVLAAVTDLRTPPALGRLVGRFDGHVDRLWQGRKTAA